MNDRTQMDQASDREQVDTATADRQPWHSPVIDIVPLRNAQATNGVAGSDGGNKTC